MPIWRVRSITAAYMAWKITRTPITTEIQITTLRNVERYGYFVGVIIERYVAIEVATYRSIPGTRLTSSTTVSALAGLSSFTYICEALPLAPVRSCMVPRGRNLRPPLPCSTIPQIWNG